MQSTERDLRQTLGSYLSARTASSKELARKIGCDPRTAEGFRAGRYWPQAKHWIGIIAEFGKDVTEAVFHPDETAQRLEGEVRELRQKLAAAETAHRLAAKAAKGVEPSRRKDAPTLPARAAELTDRHRN